ncbi:hypothetical protein RRG08_056102 [Elysia crispata]|uniref:Uncharacterized protein n=1 Tax=Elysia crispata TaxID=231223 RepID=A0AAE0ZBU8_9GAST|nr:hypothetical protein RRG08_056102 [Elysia crispata]
MKTSHDNDSLSLFRLSYRSQESLSTRVVHRVSIRWVKFVYRVRQVHYLVIRTDIGKVLPTLCLYRVSIRWVKFVYRVRQVHYLVISTELGKVLSTLCLHLVSIQWVKFVFRVRKIHDLVILIEFGHSVNALSTSVKFQQHESILALVLVIILTVTNGA